MIGASGRKRARSAAEDGRATDAEQERERGRAERSLSQDIEYEPSDEGPDEPASSPTAIVQTTPGRARGAAGHLRPGGTADGQFEQGRHRRADRSEQQAH